MSLEGYLKSILEEVGCSKVDSSNYITPIQEKKYIEKNELIWEILVPSFKKEELTVKVNGRVILVEGKKEENKNKDEEIQIIYDSCLSRVKVSSSIQPKWDISSMDCSLKEGVLKIKLKEDKNFSKKIEIK